MQNRWYKCGEELLEEIRNKVLADDVLGIWFLAQESFALKYRNRILWIDPFFTDLYNNDGTSMRQYAPPFAPEEIDCVDFAFGTHDHIDHIDINTLYPMSVRSPKARFIVPAPCARVLLDHGISENRVEKARAFEELRLADDITVIPIPAAHEQYEKNEKGEYTCLGYLIRLGDITIFHSGDSVETEDMAEMLKPFDIDVAFLPINGADFRRRAKGIIGNMNARDAAGLAEAIGADMLIPMHFDLFAGNSENPAVLADYIYRFHKDMKYHVMAHGECFLYSK